MGDSSARLDALIEDAMNMAPPFHHVDRVLQPVEAYVNGLSSGELDKWAESWQHVVEHRTRDRIETWCERREPTMRDSEFREWVWVYVLVVDALARRGDVRFEELITPASERRLSIRRDLLPPSVRYVAAYAERYCQSSFESDIIQTVRKMRPSERRELVQLGRDLSRSGGHEIPDKWLQDHVDTHPDEVDMIGALYLLWDCLEE